MMQEFWCRSFQVKRSTLLHGCSGEPVNVFVDDCTGKFVIQQVTNSQFRKNPSQSRCSHMSFRDCIHCVISTQF